MSFRTLFILLLLAGIKIQAQTPAETRLQGFEQRKQLLEKVADYIKTKRAGNEAINLIYVCTHNSRRSHLGQVWAAVAAAGRCASAGAAVDSSDTARP